MFDLTGLNIVEKEILEGCKRAIKIGNTIYVSSAMMNLIKNANQDELMHLMKNIYVQEIPEYNFSTIGKVFY